MGEYETIATVEGIEVQVRRAAPPPVMPRMPEDANRRRRWFRSFLESERTGAVEIITVQPEPAS
jgi:hypothetical protein